MTEPTEEGRRRWPPDGVCDITEPGEVCTCHATCAPRCAGDCGCAACGLAFVDFCDVAGLYSADGLTVSDDEAVARYRDVRVVAERLLPSAP